ncbi:MAG: TetR/AcrR family transcriptional regulator [Ignavibacteriales bacterium]|nr:TetR/AcrR family transcriptional regulator [Ignavibacteriales bacterium]
MGITERKEREKESRKESIIDAAQKVFFDKGLLLSTMDEIAEQAELAKGTLYLYYHSKEDLYLAVMMRGLSLLHGMLRRVIGSHGSFVATLLQLSDTYTQFYEEHKNYFRMMHFFETPQFHKQVSEEMHRSCDSVTQELWNMVIEELRQGTVQQMVRSDLSPVEITIVLWSNATTLLMRIDAQYDLWKETMDIDLKHTLRLSTQLLIESILTEKGKDELHRILNTRNR